MGNLMIITCCAQISNKMLDPVFRVFLANGTRYNLLNSAVLELLEFIRRENVKSLVQHIVEEYYTQLEGVDYVDTIMGLKLKYEQSQVSRTPTIVGPSALSVLGRALYSVRLYHRVCNLPEHRQHSPIPALT